MRYLPARRRKRKSKGERKDAVLETLLSEEGRRHGELRRREKGMVVALLYCWSTLERDALPRSGLAGEGNN